MKPTVSLETAKRLAEAGFLPPIFEQGQTWFDETGFAFLAIKTDVGGGLFKLAGGEFGNQFWWVNKSGYGVNGIPLVFAPTATDIIEQMPSGTRLVWHNEAWICAWDLDYVGASVDSREDQCPHECAAKAFLAWKAGLE